MMLNFPTSDIEPSLTEVKRYTIKNPIANNAGKNKNNAIKNKGTET
ncbi:MAG: hypothetical protein AAB475_02290 [Patescibacteria group bacterium]